MAKNRARIQEKGEFSCMWGMFRFFESHQGPASPKRISNGRPLANKHIIDYSRKLDPRASFDEECRKIQNEAELASMRVDQMVTDRKFIYKKGTVSDSKPFSDALEILSINKDLFMESPQTGDKIVIIKTTPRDTKNNVRTPCNCSSNSKAKSHFSFRRIQRKLKHTFGANRKEPNQFSQKGSIFRDDCVCIGADDIACSTDSVRKKIDLPAFRLCEKQEVDVFSEAKRHLSARLKDVTAIANPKGRKSTKTLGRILEPDLRLASPKWDSQDSSCSAQMRFSPYSSSPSPDGRQGICLTSLLKNETEVSSNDVYEEYESTIENLSTDTLISANDEPNIAEINSTLQRTETSELQDEDGSVVPIECDNQYDTDPENETLTSTADDCPSSPTSVHQLDTHDNNIKYQEDHESPVSVLEPFFTEYANSLSSAMLQKAERRLKPRCLHFEECSFAPSPHDQQTVSANESINELQDYISHYVHLVLQVSHLNWDQLSRIGPLSEELLNSSLFDEVEFLSSDHSRFGPKLLFDHINEVLTKIHKSHFCSPPWSSVVIKPRISWSRPLEEFVVGEIMSEAAEFYLLPWTEETTFDQLVAKDVSDSRSWLDVRIETEHIVSLISEDILESFVLDVVLEFHS